MHDAQALKENGWRQGSILLLEGLPAGCCFEPKLPDHSADSLLIVLTQDCDLLQEDFSKEPYVEVILATPINGKPDGNLFYGKNPRCIQFPIGKNHFQACCHNRSRFNRRILVHCQPSTAERISESNIGLLREWMAKRYVRPAFPDNLNLRIRGGNHGKSIQKILHSRGHLFQDIYLFCSPSDQELIEEQSYRVSIWLAVATEKAHDKALQEEAREVCGEINTIISNCPGIELLSCEVRAEETITLDDLRYFKPWDFDYLSHREAVQSL